MAIKDTNHRVTCTVSQDEYVRLQRRAKLDGTTVGRVASRRVTGYEDERNRADDAERVASCLAEHLVMHARLTGDWSSVDFLLNFVSHVDTVGFDDDVKRYVRRAVVNDRNMYGDR